MTRVARSEARLLALVRALVEGRGAEPWLVAAYALPPVISPAAMDLVEHTLAVGTVRRLASGGGWHREKRPVDGRLVHGRLWERHPEPPLAFSRWSFELLRHLLVTPLANGAGRLDPPEQPTAGDALLAFFAARALSQAGLHRVVDLLQGFPLVQLGFVRRLGPDALEAPWMLEALQDELADLWLGHLNELAKIRDPLALAERNLAIDRTLHAWLDFLEAADRRDLADFLVDAGRRWIAEDPAWMPALALDPESPLRARTEATRTMAAFPSVLLRLAHGIHADAQVNFFEDAYDAAQERLKRWERFGPERVTAMRNATARLTG